MSEFQILGVSLDVSLVSLVQISVIGLIREVDLAFLIHIILGRIGYLGAQMGVEQWFGRRCVLVEVRITA